MHLRSVQILTEILTGVIFYPATHRR